MNNKLNLEPNDSGNGEDCTQFYAGADARGNYNIIYRSSIWFILFLQ